MNFGQTSLAWTLLMCFLCSTTVVPAESVYWMELMHMTLNIHAEETETILSLCGPFRNWSMIAGDISFVISPMTSYSAINKPGYILQCFLELCNRFAKGIWF